MKTSINPEKDVRAVYEAYWDSYLKGDMKKMASFIDDNFKVIGSTDREVFFNKKEAIKFYKATADQIAGKAELRNRRITKTPLDGLMHITELSDLYILIEDEWAFYSKVRLSSLLQKKNNGWKFIQQHGSIPDSKAQEGEQVAFEKIKTENLELRDAVKRRTIDLENKNRELEIESALEKVRSFALAMKEPADMLEVCRIISNQLGLLKVTNIRNIQTAIINDQKGTYLNYEYFTQYKTTSILEIVTKLHPVVEEFANEILKSKDAFFTKTFKGKDLKNWIKYRKDTNQNPDPILDDAKSVHYYFYSIGPGALGISTYSPLSDENIKVFKRFRNVFALAYRRFIDIEQAIAQAKEAQIEAALERVRSRSMAMHSSEELVDASDVMFNELKKMNIETIRIGICTIDGKTGAAEIWSRSEIKGKAENKILGVVPTGSHPVFDEMVNAWREKKPFFSSERVGDEVKEYYEKLAPHLSYPERMEYNERETITTFFFEEGSLNVVSIEPLKEEDCNIMVRFAKVFGQMYTRFLDLKKAEAQNKIIKAENKRKTKELEEARQLQLAMLPKVIPNHPHLDIAVYMQTATEVGGDYYDFSINEDGSLNVALGDATGHGMKAGIMVSSMKSIFTTNSSKMDIEAFFATANSGIKSMGLKRMMMGFSMLNIQQNRLKLINAGMPPIFLYRRSSGSVEEFAEHGMPIGAMSLSQYRIRQHVLEKGDALLVLSDGLPELQNENAEMYGYERIRKGFERVAEKSPEEIVRFFKNEGAGWGKGNPPDDDVTFVVIKFK